MSRVIFRNVVASIFLILLQSPSLSAHNPQMSLEVQEWFTALTKVDQQGLNKLIAQGAKIELMDLGAVHTRDEFLENLDEWNNATRGAILLTQLISSQDGTDILEVCYRFKNYERLNRETFRYADGKITSVAQELVGTKCTGF